MVDTFVIPLLKILIILNATLVAVTYMVLLERKVIAWAQSRLGPMRRCRRDRRIAALCVRPSRGDRPSPGRAACGRATR